MKGYSDSEEDSREIPKNPETPDFSADLVAALSDLCFYQGEQDFYDLAFVFGSNILHREIAAEISALLNGQDIATVLITGGIANYRSSFYKYKAESGLILMHIDQENFPHTQFIIENKSKNTLDNVKFSLSTIDFNNFKSIFFLSHAHASMRSYLTLKEYCPKAVFGNFQLLIPSSVDEMPVDRMNWYKTEFGRELVWGEYLRIRYYGNRGDFSIAIIEDKIKKIENEASKA